MAGTIGMKSASLCCRQSAVDVAFGQNQTPFHHWDCEGVVSCLEAVHWMFLNLSQRAGRCSLFLPARENIVWLTCKLLNTSICFKSYLHPLPLRRNKGNIIPWLLKMCMTYIAEKSTRLHQCSSHSRCQRDESASVAAESHKLIDIDTKILK